MYCPNNVKLIFDLLTTVSGKIKKGVNVKIKCKIARQTAGLKNFLNSKKTPINTSKKARL